MIFSTGGTSSVFVALWVAAAIFSGVFGLWGYATILLASLSYITYIALETNGQGDSIIVASLAAIVPIVASYIIWHSPGGGSQTKDDKSYIALASELSEMASKSEVVIKAIDDGVVALNGKGNIELINPAAERLLGWSASDAITLNHKSVFHFINSKDEPISQAEDIIDLALSTGKSHDDHDLTIMTKTKKKRIIAMTVSPIGQVGTGAIAVFRDVTKERAEEREQAEFISTASHEMRTPVASIEGYLGLALNPQTASIDDKAREFIGKAQDSAKHLGRLFQDLLDVSRAEDGRLASQPSVTDVVSFIGDVSDGLLEQAKEKGLRLTYKAAVADPDEGRRLSPVYYANVDPDHLRELVSNLIENAIKYTPSGDVIVDVNGNDEQVIISVKDSGIGIPREDIPHLFQKFYRVDNSQTREIGGTGLGLYLCRRLAETMGGNISVESELQKGSTFFVNLPRLDHVQAMQMLEQAENPPEIKNVISEQPPRPRESVEETNLPSATGAQTATPIPANQPTNIGLVTEQQPVEVAQPTQLGEYEPPSNTQPSTVPQYPLQQTIASPPPTIATVGEQESDPISTPPVENQAQSSPNQQQSNPTLASIEENSSAYVRQAQIKIPPRQ
ncbi:PAS domain-containing protein [Candidatus Nomurabacteria bacterium]|nr:PAS domain-containing protein [Candidatus Nomurabacteria bacterium]